MGGEEEETESLDNSEEVCLWSGRKRIVTWGDRVRKEDGLLFLRWDIFEHVKMTRGMIKREEKVNMQEKEQSAVEGSWEGRRGRDGAGSLILSGRLTSLGCFPWEVGGDATCWWRGGRWGFGSVRNTEKIVVSHGKGKSEWAEEHS